jgi:hypothetical protein
VDTEELLTTTAAEEIATEEELLGVVAIEEEDASELEISGMLELLGISTTSELLEYSGGFSLKLLE